MKFRCGDERSHQPLLVEVNPRTLLKVAEELSITTGTIDLGELEEWMPHELSDNHKHRRSELSLALVLRNKNDNRPVVRLRSSTTIVSETAPKK